MDSDGRLNTGECIVATNSRIHDFSTYYKLTDTEHYSWHELSEGPVYPPLESNPPLRTQIVFAVSVDRFRNAK